jgi:GTP-binding protein LepA
MTDTAHIRNFSIIAHIDHGKSTLADRLIQICGGLTLREMREQVLDSMELERERGITIKAQTVRLEYTAKDGQVYELNLIDTPGHVDFAYEVNRSLAAVEGSLLVVDASQGVEAQTLANVYQAIEVDHEIIPILNKVDLPAAEPDRIRQQIEDVIGIDASGALEISAKTGPASPRCWRPSSTACRRPRATPMRRSRRCWSIPGTTLSRRRGADPHHRRPHPKKGQRIKLISTDASYQVEQVGIFRPKREQVASLDPGEIGFFTAAIKEVADTRVGDTITEEKRPCKTPLPNFKPAQPVVFAGFFPVDSADFDGLRAPSAGCASTMRASSMKWKAPPPSASASAAAFSACCTWRSCASGSTASSTST